MMFNIYNYQPNHYRSAFLLRIACLILATSFLPGNSPSFKAIFCATLSQGFFYFIIEKLNLHSHFNFFEPPTSALSLICFVSIFMLSHFIAVYKLVRLLYCFHSLRN